MRDDPGLETASLGDCLQTNYGIAAATIAFMPVGYDPNAAAYRVDADDGTVYFAKVRCGHVSKSALRVPWALAGHGVPNVLAPLATRSSEITCPLERYPGYRAVLYPYIEGRNASEAGLSDVQWRDFGATLRAVHDSGLHETLRDELWTETFDLRSAGLVRRIAPVAHRAGVKGEGRQGFAAWWRLHDRRIRHVLDRAEHLGRRLQSIPLPNVLCHADIHAGNILAGDDARIHLIDWDAPVIAPRERDLLFVVGSVIARTVQPSEEICFFEGYGPVDVNPLALAYYRYERVIEDLGVFGSSVLEDEALSDEAVDDTARIVASFFEPGGMIERAETVVIHHPIITG